MSHPDDGGWAGALHRLWSAATAAADPGALDVAVSAALLELPGAFAAGTIAQDRKGRTEHVSWVNGDGGPNSTAAVARDIEQVVSRRHSPVLIVDLGRGVPELTALAATSLDRPASTLLVGGFVRSGGGTVHLLVAVAGGRDATPGGSFAQVVDVARTAGERLAGQGLGEETRNRDALLAEASLQMDAELDVTQTLRRVARMVVPAIAEGCLVYLGHGDGVRLMTGVHVDARRQLPVDEPGRDPQWLRDLATRATAEPPGGAGGAARELGPAARLAVGARALATTVLRARGRVLGVLVFLFDRAVDRLPDPALLEDLTRRAALAIDNAELYEQRRHDVMTLQSHLLPTGLPDLDGVTTAAAYAVGDQILEVGGDFYDIVPHGTGGAAMIGDVCGRGVAAAALTGMARHTLGTLLREGASGERALTRLNAALRRDGSWRFVTGAVATFHCVPHGGLAVRLASAGHPAPLVVRASGRVSRAGGGGLLLGVRDRAGIGRSRLRLAVGDTLLLFTDGLTEARDDDGAMFEDSATLAEALARLSAAPVAVLVEELCRLAVEFRRSGADDIAVLGVRAADEGNADV
jgi:serine phosphatase RsbU (regulator of sigma subunit)